MKGLRLLKYMLLSYSRSYRYFGPLAFILIGVAFLYSYTPNPVMGSYSVTASIQFIGCAWLGISFLNHDQGRQQALLILHIGNAALFYAVQYAALSFLCIILSTGTVLYPILIGAFDGTAAPAVFVLAWLSHILVSLLGAAVALFFQNSWIENYGRAAGLLLIVIVLSFSGLSLADQLPQQLRFLPWVLPPVSPLVDMMMNEEAKGIAGKAALFIFVLAYCCLLLAVYIKASCAKDPADFGRKAG